MKISKGLLKAVSRKTRQYNNQKEKITNNGPQQITRKTKDWATRTQLKTGGYENEYLLRVDLNDLTAFSVIQNPYLKKNNNRICFMTSFYNQKHHKNNVTVILHIGHHFYEMVHEGGKGGLKLRCGWLYYPLADILKCITVHKYISTKVFMIFIK